MNFNWIRNREKKVIKRLEVDVLTVVYTTVYLWWAMSVNTLFEITKFNLSLHKTTYKAHLWTSGQILLDLWFADFFFEHIQLMERSAFLHLIKNYFFIYKFVYKNNIRISHWTCKHQLNVPNKRRLFVHLVLFVQTWVQEAKQLKFTLKSSKFFWLY